MAAHPPRATRMRLPGAALTVKPFLRSSSMRWSKLIVLGCARRKNMNLNYRMAPMAFILSLDEGTTSARAVLYDEAGRVVSMESSPITCLYPHPGWVEQDALEIWRSQMDATRRLLDKTRVAPRDIVA